MRISGKKPGRASEQGKIAKRSRVARCGFPDKARSAASPASIDSTGRAAISSPVGSNSTAMCGNPTPETMRSA